MATVYIKSLILSRQQSEKKDGFIESLLIKIEIFLKETMNTPVTCVQFLSFVNGHFR